MVRRASSFSATGLPVRPRTPDAGEAGRQLDDPLAHLLRSLRGRQVILQIGNQFRAGRLILVDPVILVTADGQAVQVRFESIQAVEF